MTATRTWSKRKTPKKILRPPSLTIHACQRAAKPVTFSLALDGFSLKVSVRMSPWRRLRSVLFRWSVVGGRSGWMSGIAAERSLKSKPDDRLVPKAENMTRSDQRSVSRDRGKKEKERKRRKRKRDGGEKKEWKVSSTQKASVVIDGDQMVDGNNVYSIDPKGFDHPQHLPISREICVTINIRRH